MGDYNEETGTVELPPKNVLVKRRLVTIFCYLNDLEESQGGCTWFPKCNNFRARPKKGRAVVFSNVIADGMPDPRTIHAGEVVVDNREEVQGKDGRIRKTGKMPIKYGLNIWACEN